MFRVSRARRAARFAVLLAAAWLAQPGWTQADPAAPPAARKAATRAEAKPGWAELTPSQQQSLAPLSASWRRLSAAHKRKWIALSANYPHLPPAEQALLHSRMAEWAALSPQQRSQARLNFADTQALPKGDKKAQWEAYQALPAEEKRKLAAGASRARPSAPPTAAATRPAPSQKLVKLPKARKEPAPRLAVAPGRVDARTLLPRPPAAAAPVPPAAAPLPPPTPAPLP